MASDKTWLEVFVEQNGDSNDYNDSEDVLGWLTVTLHNGVLTVKYESDTGAPGVFEHYRLVRTDHG